MNTTPKEETECRFFAAWLSRQEGVLSFTHIPNETFIPVRACRRCSMRLKRAKAKILQKNRAMGVRRGALDYLVVTEKATLFIEVKRVKGGVVSDEQEKWLHDLKLSGQIATVCKGFEEAKAFVKQYL